MSTCCVLAGDEAEAAGLWQCQVSLGGAGGWRGRGLLFRHLRKWPIASQGKAVGKREGYRISTSELRVLSDHNRFYRKNYVLLSCEVRSFKICFHEVMIVRYNDGRKKAHDMYMRHT